MSKGTSSIRSCTSLVGVFILPLCRLTLSHHHLHPENPGFSSRKRHAICTNVPRTDSKKLTDALELPGFASFALGKFHVVSADTRSSSPQAHPRSDQGATLVGNPSVAPVVARSVSSRSPVQVPARRFFCCWSLNAPPQCKDIATASSDHIEALRPGASSASPADAVLAFQRATCRTDGREKGTSLLSTVCEGKEPRGHARKRLMQAA